MCIRDRIYGDLGEIIKDAVKKSGLVKEVGVPRGDISEHLGKKTEKGRLLIELVDHVRKQPDEESMKKAVSTFLKERNIPERRLFEFLEEDLNEHLQIRSREGHELVKSIKSSLRG